MFNFQLAHLITTMPLREERCIPIMMVFINMRKVDMYTTYFSRNDKANSRIDPLLQSRIILAILIYNTV